jgi:release factor glutamine methyltransferase
VGTATIRRRLAAAGCVSPDEEAEGLVAAAPAEDTLEAWVRRREVGEPLAWIIGGTTFCGSRIRVDPGVYVPRPQTEALARRAAVLLPDGGSAADLCTGSGAVASHLSRVVPSARVIATDVDPRAVTCARANGVAVIHGEFGRALRAEAFDVVTAVAPYVPTAEIALLPEDVRTYEPSLALDGGADGLDAVRRVVADASRLLRAGGWLLTEIGGHQDALLEPVLGANGFEPPERWLDEESDLRGIAVRRR